MARGIGAFMFITSLVLAMTILTGMGFYGDLGMNIDASSQNADVQRAVDQLNSTEFGENRGASILEGPLAVVVPFIQVLNTFTTVLGNTSGILQLLFGLPKLVADTLETVFQLAMLVTTVFAIRGILQ